MTSGSPMPTTARPPDRSTRASSTQAASRSVMKYTVLTVMSASTESSSSGSAVSEPDESRSRPARRSESNRDLARRSMSSAISMPCTRPSSPMRSSRSRSPAAPPKKKKKKKKKKNDPAGSPSRQPMSATDAAARRRRCVDGGGDRPLIALVECTRDEWTQDPVGAAKLPGHGGQQPITQGRHGSRMPVSAPADAWPLPKPS